MAGFNPNRIDKGVRAGGQFTYATHAESSVSLGGASTLTVDEAPSQTPAAYDLAAVARERLTAPIRAAETVSDMDRALAAYASRTTKSGTWHDYLPDLHGGLPTRNQLLAAMRAFEDATRRLANLPSVRAATDALAVIERRKAEYFAQRRNHERTYGSLQGFSVPRPDISAERHTLASAAPAAAGEHVRDMFPTAAIMTFRKDSTGNLFLAAAFDAQGVDVAGYRKDQLDPKSQKAKEIIERRPGVPERVVQPRGIFRPTGVAGFRPCRTHEVRPSACGAGRGVRRSSSTQLSQHPDHRSEHPLILAPTVSAEETHDCGRLDRQRQGGERSAPVYACLPV
ncbi:hypothetical protein ACX80N_12505 [Arthrobacter sp. MDT2-16]